MASKFCTTKKFIEKAILKHGNKYDYSLVKYIKSTLPIDIICDKHGIFTQIANNHLNGNDCPKCKSKYKSELKLLNTIRDNFKKLDIISQGTPSWLNKNKERKSLDIYFPIENIAIEYQGKQHFTSVKGFGGDSGYLLCKQRDELKYEVCNKNNCKLYYFTYNKEDIPNDYPHYVYNKEEELISKLKEELNY